MSEIVFVLLLAAVPLGLILIQAVLLLFTGKLLRAPKATFWRSLVASVLLGVVSLALVFGRYELSRFAVQPPSWFDLIILLVVAIGLQSLLILACFRTSFGRAILIWLLTSIPLTLLVLGVRAYGVEGFVVPTGAMADTIYGYHKDVTCPECGHPFAVNCSIEAERVGGRENFVRSCTCPNCRADIPMLTREGTPGYETRSGERILVSKLPTIIFGGSPTRSDVVVFSYPVAEELGDSPVKYVKRVIGLPGETIAIREGKIYVLPPDKSPKYDDSEVNPKDLWKSQHLHENDPAALEKFRGGEFAILRKSPDLVLALRQLVYDNDQPSSLLKGKQPPRWQGDGWKEDGDALRHAGEKRDWLRYQHLLRDGKPHLITDFSGYNSGQSGEGGERWVGDVIIECEANLEPTAEELTLELAHGPDHFRARFDAKTGSCTLLRLSDDKEEPLATEPTLLRPGPHRIRFANVDARLLVWVDDALPFGDGVAYEPAESLGPWINDFTPAAIGVRGAVGLSKLKLWRDVYYTTGTPAENLSRDDMSVFNGGGRLSEPPVRTFFVHPGHYLALGDNSAASADGRYWGLVPERLHIGPVVCRYYPVRRGGRVR